MKGAKSVLCVKICWILIVHFAQVFFATSSNLNSVTGKYFNVSTEANFFLQVYAAESDCWIVGLNYHTPAKFTFYLQLELYTFYFNVIPDSNHIPKCLVSNL